MTQQLPATDPTNFPNEGNYNPLVVVRTSSGTDLVNPGSTFQLNVTIHNQGPESAIIYAYIEERSPQLRQWCSSMQECVALGADQSGEVHFQIKVPGDALPETLEYDLVVDASDSYPDYPPIRYKQQQLQVLIAESTKVQSGDSVFHVLPQTSTQTPASIQPGVGLPIQIWVENRSDRVDRFRLNCAGLSPDWETTITYPQDNQGLGLIVAADSMGLNPGARGQILLFIKPPINALAGNYIPTLRLSSQNNPDLNLLDLVYLDVAPTYLLQPTLQILRSEVRQQVGLFEIRLQNSGNTHRDVDLQVQNLSEPKGCHYTLAQEQVTVFPQTTQRVMLEAEPQQWWRQPIYGSGRAFNFRIELEDPEGYPLIADTLQGTVTWAARPWWQLLLLVLAALGVLGTLAWLIWWNFLRPPAVPKILDFAVEDTRYAEAKGDVVRVGWQIEHPENVKTLKITGYSDDGKILSGPLSYELTGDDIPSGLVPHCQQQKQILSCSNVRTDARKAGDYTFELTIVPAGRRRSKSIQERSDVAVIEPKPMPMISGFFASDILYQEFSPEDQDVSSNGQVQGTGSQFTIRSDDCKPIPIETNPEEGNTVPGIPTIDGAGIRLNWCIENIRELKSFTLIGRTADGTKLGEITYEPLQEAQGIDRFKNLPASCGITDTEDMIICRDFPTTIYQAATYQFELQTTALGQASVTDEAASAEPMLTEPIKIQPLPPRIVNFLVENEIAAPKYVIPIETGVFAPTLKIDWAVAGGNTTQVSLLPAPGSVGAQGSMLFPLKPESGSTTLTLQAQNADGETITQAIVFETFDPTQPVTPEQVAAAAAAAAAGAATEAAAAQQAGETDLPPGMTTESLEGSGSVDAGRLSPGELPPRFN